MLWLEDFQPGEVRRFGRWTLTAADITSFAEKYDPQPFHLSPERAAQSPFGGLIASGWQLLAICMRLMLDGLGLDNLRESSLGSPGADEIRWLRPARVGDTLSLKTEVIDVRPSERRADRGTVRWRYEVYNQNDEVVMTLIAMGMFRRKGATPPL